MCCHFISIIILVLAEPICFNCRLGFSFLLLLLTLLLILSLLLFLLLSLFTLFAFLLYYYWMWCLCPNYLCSIIGNAWQYCVFIIIINRLIIKCRNFLFLSLVFVIFLHVTYSLSNFSCEYFVKILILNSILRNSFKLLIDINCQRQVENIFQKCTERT